MAKLAFAGQNAGAGFPARVRRGRGGARQRPWGGVAAVADRARPPGPQPAGTCFDLFGVDILLTAALEPVLLEVNNGPMIAVTGADQRDLNNAVHRQLADHVVPLLAAHPPAGPPPPACAGAAWDARLARFLQEGQVPWRGASHRPVLCAPGLAPPCISGYVSVACSVG